MHLLDISLIRGVASIKHHFNLLLIGAVVYISRGAHAVPEGLSGVHIAWQHNTDNLLLHSKGHRLIFTYCLLQFMRSCSPVPDESQGLLEGLSCRQFELFSVRNILCIQRSSACVFTVFMVWINILGKSFPSIELYKFLHCIAIKILIRNIKKMQLSNDT